MISIVAKLLIFCHRYSNQFTVLKYLEIPTLRAVINCSVCCLS